MNLNGRLSYEGNVSGNLGPELVADVEANPSGPATQTLVKIRVGDVIYSIPTGGGGGGVTSYSLLNDKPKINNHTIDGDMTSADLDLQDKIEFPEDGSKYLDGNGDFSTPPVYIPINYTNFEQDTGIKWIDGRSIYQITSSAQTNTPCDNLQYTYLPLNNPPLNPQKLIHCIIHGQVPNTNRTFRFLANNYQIEIASLTSEYILQNTEITFQYVKDT